MTKPSRSYRPFANTDQRSYFGDAPGRKTMAGRAGGIRCSHIPRPVADGEEPARRKPAEPYLVDFASDHAGRDTLPGSLVFGRVIVRCRAPGCCLTGALMKVGGVEVCVHSALLVEGVPGARALLRIRKKCVQPPKAA